jgi:hypothetical protein
VLTRIQSYIFGQTGVAVREQWIIAAAIAATFVGGFYLKSWPSKEAPSKEPETLAQKCAISASMNYVRLRALLSIKENEAMLLNATTVDLQISQRRLEEDYCLQVARCRLLDLPAQTGNMAYSAMFSSCLDDEEKQRHEDNK